MPTDTLVFLSLAILVIAFLYASVGHAGASGYIAVMTLFGLTATVIKPAALVLNIMVATIAFWQFQRAGYFSWSLFWPFALGSIPLAFVGGVITLPTQVMKIIIGIVLLYSAFRFMIEPKERENIVPPDTIVSLAVGSGLGFLSGLTGVGGGVFLTPILILMKWSRTKQASAVSALFILVNSISGLLGNVSSTKQLPFFAIPFGIAAVTGGSIGAYFGSKRFSPMIIRRLLASVLIIAGIKYAFNWP